LPLCIIYISKRNIIISLIIINNESTYLHAGGGVSPNEAKSPLTDLFKCDRNGESSTLNEEFKDSWMNLFCFRISQNDKFCTDIFRSECVSSINHKTFTNVYELVQCRWTDCTE